MQVPADKYLLQDYRDDMRTPDAPQFIDTEAQLIPVKNIGTGLPKPNSKQRVLTYHAYNNNAAAFQTQIATNSATYRYYFLGAIYMGGDAAGGRQCSAWDGTSGTSPAATNGSTTMLSMATLPTTGATVIEFAGVPIPVNNGIRISVDVAAAAGYLYMTVFYMEERIA